MLILSNKSQANGYNVMKGREGGGGKEGEGGEGKKGCNKIIILLIVDCILNFKFACTHFSLKSLCQLPSQ